MITSSAIADHGLQVEQYFMLNAAVAMEAYDDANEDVDDMRPDDWDNYTNRVWASEWHQLFASSDSRHGLTWRGRFQSISNAVNYYSSTEDVLANGIGETPDIGTMYAWVNQEMRKGTTLIWLGPGNEEGGWGKNIDYLLYSMGTINNLPDAEIRTNSVFCSFDDTDIYGTNGSAVVSNPQMRAQLLADAIPALSNPAGRNSLNGAMGLGDVDYMTNAQRNHGFRRGLCEDGEWPRDEDDWQHSDIKKIAYPYNYLFFDDLVTRGGLDD